MSSQTGPLSSSDKVTLTFGWSGEISKGKGAVEIKIVDLLFKDAKTKISVHLPDNLPTTSLQKLPFTCTRIHSIPSETRPERLNVTIEQVQNLTLQAGYFEKGQDEKSCVRKDSRISIDHFQSLEVGKQYRLVITSKDLELKASLVKEETPSFCIPEIPKSQEKSQRIIDEEYLFPLLEQRLIFVMGLHVLLFNKALLPYRGKVQIKQDIDPGSLPVAAIKTAITKLDVKKLQDLMETVRELRKKCENVQGQTKQDLEKTTSILILKTFGDQGLKDMMSGILEPLIEGTISQEVKGIIEDICSKFAKHCLIG